MEKLKMINIRHPIAIDSLIVESKIETLNTTTYETMYKLLKLPEMTEIRRILNQKRYGTTNE